MTDTELISSDTCNAIIDIENKVTQKDAYNAAYLEARKRGIAKPFKDSYQSCYDARRISTFDPSTNVTDFTDQPITLKCGAWLANDAGIYRTYTRDGTTMQIAACARPIMPIEVLVNIEDNTERVRLWYMSDKPKTTTQKRSMIASATKIVELSDSGVSVSSDNAKELVKYLQFLLDENIDGIPRSKSASCLGWYGSNFLPYDDGIAFDGEDANRAIFDAIHTSGDEIMWREETRSWRKNKVLRLMMAASFAAPLLELLGISSYIVHIYGTTSTAKTVGMMVAASIWADPTAGRFWKSLNGTVNAVNGTLGYLRNLPCMFDELQTVKESINFNKFIMTATEGIDKLRNSGDKTIRPRTWRTTILTTGEDPLIQQNAGGGTVNRVIQIEPDAPLVEDGKAAADFVRQNYGWAGKRYIAALQDLHNTSQQTIADMFKLFFNDIMAAGKTTDKLAQSASALLCADYIADTAIWREGKPMTVEDILPYLSSASEVDNAVRAEEFARGWLAQSTNHFYNNAGGAEGVNSEVYGTYDAIGVYVIKNVLTSAMTAAGFDYNAVKKRWADSGFLIRQGDRYDDRKGVAGVSPKCVLLSR